MSAARDSGGISPEIARLASQLSKDPKSKLFIPLAEEYMKEGMVEEAIMTLDDGLRHNPGYMSARVMLGKAYLNKGDVDNSCTQFEAVVKAVPDNLYAHKKLGEIYVHQGRRDEAIKSFKILSMLNPADEDAVSKLKTLESGIMPESTIVLPKEEKEGEEKADKADKAVAEAPKAAPQAEPEPVPEEPVAEDERVESGEETVPSLELEPETAGALAAEEEEPAPQEVTEPLPAESAETSGTVAGLSEAGTEEPAPGEEDGPSAGEGADTGEGFIGGEAHEPVRDAGGGLFGESSAPAGAEEESGPQVFEIDEEPAGGGGSSAQEEMQAILSEYGEEGGEEPEAAENVFEMPDEISGPEMGGLDFGAVEGGEEAGGAESILGMPEDISAPDTGGLDFGAVEGGEEAGGAENILGMPEEISAPDTGGLDFGAVEGGEEAGGAESILGMPEEISAPDTGGLDFGALEGGEEAGGAEDIFGMPEEISAPDTGGLDFGAVEPGEEAEGEDIFGSGGDVMADIHPGEESATGDVVQAEEPAPFETEASGGEEGLPWESETSEDEMPLGIGGTEEAVPGEPSFGMGTEEPVHEETPFEAPDMEGPEAPFETVSGPTADEFPGEAEPFGMGGEETLAAEEEAAPEVEIEVEAVTEENEEPGEPFSTEALADMYVQQGFYDRAINIYKELLSESPDNNGLKQKLEDLYVLDGMTSSSRAEEAEKAAASAEPYEPVDFDSIPPDEPVEEVSVVKPDEGRPEPVQVAGAETPEPVSHDPAVTARLEKFLDNIRKRGGR